ncbi:MAG TPA: hypothetical protein VHL08_10760 [Dongiaceae bacterium]|jgi:flagellar motility protein MotE (MotC chaperone)|nr:hypothetical protein [Dongiaceae bacterium]
MKRLAVLLVAAALPAFAQNAAQPPPPASAALSTSATPPQSSQQAPQATPPAKFDPLSLTDSELAILQKLNQRRIELEQRSQELNQRETMIAASEKRLEQKSGELKMLKAQIDSALKQHDEEQEKQIRSLVALYETMKPKDAAHIFEELDMDVLLDVISRMSERKAAPILGLVSPARAKEITVELADRRKLPIAP